MTQNYCSGDERVRKNIETRVRAIGENLEDVKVSNDGIIIGGDDSQSQSRIGA